MAATHVLLADKSERVRQVLTDLLCASGNTGIVEGVSSLQKAVERIEQEPIDMVIVELSSISQQELDNLATYRERFSRVSWVVVSMFPDLRSIIEDRLRESDIRQ